LYPPVSQGSHVTQLPRGASILYISSLDASFVVAAVAMLLPKPPEAKQNGHSSGNHHSAHNCSSKVQDSTGQRMTVKDSIYMCAATNQVC
jgi:hypothetical protein